MKITDTAAKAAPPEEHATAHTTIALHQASQDAGWPKVVSYRVFCESAKGSVGLVYTLHTVWIFSRLLGLCEDRRVHRAKISVVSSIDHVRTGVIVAMSRSRTAFSLSRPRYHKEDPGGSPWTPPSLPTGHWTEFTVLLVTGLGKEEHPRGSIVFTGCKCDAVAAIMGPGWLGFFPGLQSVPYILRTDAPLGHLEPELCRQGVLHTVYGVLADNAGP